MIRVVVVDDVEPWREFVALALQRDPEYTVIGYASDGPTAIRVCERLRPDLVVLDIGLPGCDGITAAKEIRRILRECNIIFLSQHFSAEYAQAAFEAGAHGLIAKRKASKLLRAIKIIMQGERFLTEDDNSDECDSKIA